MRASQHGYLSMRVGSGIGPLIRALVLLACSTISFADASRILWSYASILIFILSVSPAILLCPHSQYYYNLFFNTFDRNYYTSLSLHRQKYPCGFSVLSCLLGRKDLTWSSNACGHRHPTPQSPSLTNRGSNPFGQSCHFLTDNSSQPLRGLLATPCCTPY